MIVAIGINEVRYLSAVSMEILLLAPGAFLPAERFLSHWTGKRSPTDPCSCSQTLSHYDLLRGGLRNDSVGEILEAFAALIFSTNRGRQW